jgi:hypothetical protein
VRVTDPFLFAKEVISRHPPFAKEGRGGFE